MKFKSLLFVLCLGLFSSAFADTRAALDYSARPNNKPVEKSVTKKVMQPGFCEIEVANYSNTALNAWGRSSTGGILRTTYIPYNGRLKIDLYDYVYGECPDGMDLNIETVRGDLVYSRFTFAHTLVEVTSSWGMLKAQVKAK
jgi:hypothetical protein